MIARLRNGAQPAQTRVGRGATSGRPDGRRRPDGLRSRLRDNLSAGVTTMPVVGIIGAGVMGKDVAITCAAQGYDVVLCDHDPAVLSAAAGDIRALVRRYRLMAPDEPRWKDKAIPGRIRTAENLAELMRLRLGRGERC